MNIFNSSSQPEDNHTVIGAIKSYGKVILGLMVLFVGLVLFYKFVLLPWRDSMSDNPDNPKGYLNNITITRLSNQLDINKEQATKVFVIYRGWKVRNEELSLKYDSLNALFENKRSVNDSLACEALVLKLIDYELQINGNTSRFYNSVQDVLTREQTAKMLHIVRDQK